MRSAWAQRTVDEILGAVGDAVPDAGSLTRLQADANPLLAFRGFALEAAFCCRRGAYDEALAALDRATTTLRPLPVPLFVLRMSVRLLKGESAGIARDMVDAGCAWLDDGQTELGVEALGAGFVEDSAGALSLVADVDVLLRATRYYEAVTRRCIRPLRGDRPASSRLRVGILVPNLVDDVVAYSRRVMDFVRHADPAQYECFVYSSENLCVRRRTLPCRYQGLPSTESGRGYLKELEARGIPVHLASRLTPPVETACSLAARMAEDALDMLLFQSGPSMPIDWLAVRLAPVDVKVHIHIGTPAYQQGVDVTLFDNQINMERERLRWPAGAGDLEFLAQGTDLQALAAEPAMSRQSLGIPDDAVVVGVLGNHLDTRLSPQYLAAIIGAMRQNSRLWFVPAGGRILPAGVADVFTGAGLRDRVRHVASLRRPGGYLKMLDVYANEFPVGGSQAVVEAMGCGVPVIAMRAGSRHVESAGVEIVGREWAIQVFDSTLFQKRLVDWAADAGQRREVGAAMKVRAREHFSIPDYVRKVLELGRERLEAKRLIRLRA